MATKRSDMPANGQSSERDDSPESYEFVPGHLRHHFKTDRRPIPDEESIPEDRELIRRARQTRSAHLVATFFSQLPPQPQLLYSNTIEQAITARMTYSRALDELTQYFNHVTEKVTQLEILRSNSAFDKWNSKFPTLVQTQRKIVNVCQGCLTDCDVYLGMYEALPSPPNVSPTPIVHFVACSTKSSMLHQRLEYRPQVTGNQSDEHQLGSRSITIQVMDTKEAIVVDDVASLDRHELHRFKANETLTGPFSCFPLVSGNRSIVGVLSVDACRKAQRLLPQSMSIQALYVFLVRMQLPDAAMELKKAKMDGARFLALTELDLRRYQRLKVATRKRLLELIRTLQRGSRLHLVDSNERAPLFTQDDNVLEFLDGISTLAGSFLAAYRRIHWIREIANVSRSSVCTAYDVYDVVIRAITRSMEPLERVVVWKITKKTKRESKVASEWDIDVVASTSVPDDRLAPFLDGQDHKIKRIALYKENDHAIRASCDDGTSLYPSLIRGGILHIHSDPVSSTTSRSQRWEAATYQISWSDRSLQTLSWAQLRQFLPIRNVNSKHFQIRQLCHQLEEEEIKSKTQQMSKIIRIHNPNGLVVLLRDSSRSQAIKYVLEVDFAAQFEPSPDFCDFISQAVVMAEQALACVRGREARHALRQRTVAKQSQRFHSIGLNPSADALRALHDLVHNVFEDIVECLPGVHAQIAELQADGVQLKYRFVSQGSTVLGCSLNRGQGVSFQCLDTKMPVIVTSTSELRTRLQRIGVFRHRPQAMEEAFPFLFFPLLYEDSSVGVLTIDSFQKVPKGRYDEGHPETGILDFLVPLAKLLARAIYTKRRSYALYELELSCQDPLRSPQQLLFYACRALKDVVVGGWKVRVVEVDGVQGKSTLVYEFSESERELSRSGLFNVVRPLAFRVKELCTDTIVSYLTQLQAGETINNVSKLLAAIRQDELEHEQIVQRYQQLIDEDQIVPRRAAVEMEKAKLVERQIADNYLFLLKDVPAISTEAAASARADRITNERYIAHALKMFLGASSSLYSEMQALSRPASKLFLTLTTLPHFHASCDSIYLQRVTNLTSKYMTKLQETIHRSRVRTAALSEFRERCQKVLNDHDISLPDPSSGRYEHTLSPGNEVEMECLLQLQRDTIALIERTLGSPNVYFGMWEPALRILRYTSASVSSIMTGKKLKHGNGVSFLALEKQLAIVVTSRDVEKTGSYFKKLRYFTNEPIEERKWPFIVVPVGTLGVLALDNLYTYEQASHELQPELGVVDFLRKLGQHFAEVLTVVRERTVRYRQQLRDDALVRIMSACENLKPSADNPQMVSLYLPHLVLQEIENALNGVDAYIGLVAPLSERIRFICASPKSQMDNKSVDTTQSLSFRGFASQRVIVIPNLSQHFQEQENLQQHDRKSRQKLKFFGNSRPPQGPFVCVPIPFVGTLSVDTFPGAAGGVFSPAFPEDGVVAFLEKAANYLGENLRTLAANDARKLLPDLFQGNRTTFPLLFQEIFILISRNLLAVYAMQTLRYECDKNCRKWGRKRVVASMQRSTSDDQVEMNAEEELSLIQSLEERFHQQVDGEIVSKKVFQPVHQLSRYPEILVVHCLSTRDGDDDEATLIPTVLVLRRVKGATWMYDEEFLLSILPNINSLITLVNIRVEGIVARRLATRKINEVCMSLESLPPSEATQTMYKTIFPSVMETIGQAMSRDNGDVYLGERELTNHTKSQASHLQLRFAAASSQSLMLGVAINLEKVDNFSLPVVQSLRKQQFTQLVLSREPFPVRMLTSKSAQRVFLAAPMGDNYVLCADSLGPEAFGCGKFVHVVEPDVVTFFKAAASRLHEEILSTRHRVSYDQLRSLTTRPHTDLRLFYSTILDGLRRDLVDIHSQQILTLGEDFTSLFRLEAWQRSSTRRPVKTLPEHYCAVNWCDRAQIQHEIHSETQMFLPMTNVPRTLDTSRSRLQPVEGIEKHGANTCACFAVMLDTSVAAQGGDAKLALCIFSHDVKTTEEREMIGRTKREKLLQDERDSSVFFTNYQRQYFFAFAAVVCDVYTHVFRACALETFTTELFLMLQEYLDAKDGVVVRFTDGSCTRATDALINDDGYASTTSTAQTLSLKTPIVLFSQQQHKIPPGRALRGKLDKKIRQFEASKAPVTIFMTKKTSPAPPVKASQDTINAARSVKSKGMQEQTPAKRRGPISLFRGNNFFRYGKKKKHEEEEFQKQKELIRRAPELQSLSPSRAQQLRHEKVSLHVFVRALEYQGRHDLIVFTIEKQSVQAAKIVEKVIREVRTRSELIATQILTNPPNGYEEINAKRFLSPSQRGGGGFLLISLLKQAQANFQQIEGRYGAAMRQFLTGAQATARDADSNVNDNWSAMFATTSESGEVTTTLMMALLRVTLVACGSKRESVVTLSETNLIKEYLKMQAGRKLLQLDPTDKKVWGTIGRARILLRSYKEILHEVESRSVKDTKPIGDEADVALQALVKLLLAQSAVVRYLNYLETEVARERNLFSDEPATKVQCFIRQTQARAQVKKRRRERHAAVAIQCAFRQYLARRRVLFMKWTRAAIRVQRAFRRRRQRAKGSRPRRFTTQLLSVTQHDAVTLSKETLTDGAWRTDMATFGSFHEYFVSKIGREQRRKEEELMWRHRREIERERARLPRDEALREDVGDLFELLDEVGSSELGRERAAALITRLHVPLNQEEVADVVAMMDSDGSGGISMDEFMRWFAYEFPLLQKRAPRVCGVVTRRDWQWVIQQSARSVLLKRWRAMRAGAMATAPRGSTRSGQCTVGTTKVQEGVIWEENDNSEEEEEG